jgi:beta-lactamase regulating signal transducer with metallopeptidase domain
MSGVERLMAEVLVDGAVRLAIVVFVAELATRRVISLAPAGVHRIWRIVAAAALLLPLIPALVPASLRIQPDSSTFGLVTAEDGGLVRYAVWIALAGAGFGICRLIAGLASMHVLARRSVVLSRLSRARRRPVFLETDRIAVPVTFGLRRAYVVLPAGWRRWDRRRLRAVIVHELAHVRRADYAVGLIAALVRAIWWWHPASWIIGARLSLTAELACDARASATMGPAIYAKELLAVAAESGGQRLRYGWTVGADSRLSTRIDALLASGAPSPDRSRGTSLALALVIGALAITTVAASVRFTPLSQLRVFDEPMDHQALHTFRHRH